MASLLETFMIMFESNADEVKKGEDEASKSGERLENTLGSVDRAAHEMGSQIIGTLKEVAVGMAAAFGVHAIADSITELAEYNDQLMKTADRLGINVSDLDAWQQAAKRTGGSAEGFNSSLDALNRGLVQAGDLGMGRMKPVLDELGLKATDSSNKLKPLTQIMLELSDKFKEMGKQKSAGYAQLLGIDQGTLMLLQEGRDGVQELVDHQKSLGVLTEESGKKAEEFNDSLDDMKQQLRGVYTSIGSAVLPVLTRLFHGIQEVFTYLGQHKGLVTGAFVAAAAVVVTLYTPAMISAAAATWAALAPILAIAIPIAALGAAFALAFEDIQNFLEGNKSVTGELAKRWPIVGDTIRSVAGFIGDAFDTLKEVGASLMDVFGALWSAITAGAKLTWAILQPVVSFIGDAISSLLPSFKGFGDGLLAIFKPIIAIFKGVASGLRWLAGEANAATEKINGTSNAAADAKSKAAAPAGTMEAAQQSISAGRASYAAAAGSSFNSATTTNMTQQTKHTTVSVGNITIQTQATDAEGISKEMGTQLQTQLAQAMDHFDDGVTA